MAEADRGLEDREVAITGRLASMTRKEAVRRIEAARGRYAMTVDAGTDLLAIGRAGLPLGPNGHPTRSVQQAQELRDEERGMAFALSCTLADRIAAMTPAT